MNPFFMFIGGVLLLLVAMLSMHALLKLDAHAASKHQAVPWFILYYFAAYSGAGLAITSTLCWVFGIH